MSYKFLPSAMLLLTLRQAQRSTAYFSFSMHSQTKMTPNSRLFSLNSNSDGRYGSNPEERVRLEKLTVPALKDLLRVAKMPVSGRKAELIDRLLTASPELAAFESTSGPEPRGKGQAAVGSGVHNRERQSRIDSRAVIARDKTLRRREIDARTRQRGLGPHTLRAVSWNVNGLRALLKRPEPLLDLVSEERPHLLFLQETKLQEAHVPGVEAELKALLSEHVLPTYDMYWSCSGEGGSVGRKGYSGVAALVDNGGRLARPPSTVEKGVGDPVADTEGRTLTVRWDDSLLPSLAVTTVYVPNSGEGLRRLDYRCGTWDNALASLLARLEGEAGSEPGGGEETGGRRQKVLVCGDFNVAFGDDDFFNPNEKRMERQAGTTPEERASFRDKLLHRHRRFAIDSTEDGGADDSGMLSASSTRMPWFGDTFRAVHGGPPGSVSPYYRQGPTPRSTPGVMAPPAGAKEADAAEPAPYPRGVFSYWSQRARNRDVNRGLRLDCFLASPEAMPLVSDAFVRDDIYGSDHCPVGVDIELPGFLSSDEF